MSQQQNNEIEERIAQVKSKTSSISIAIAKLTRKVYDTYYRTVHRVSLAVLGGLKSIHNRSLRSLTEAEQVKFKTEVLREVKKHVATRKKSTLINITGDDIYPF